jgi:hypothetical protein
MLPLQALGDLAQPQQEELYPLQMTVARHLLLLMLTELQRQQLGPLLVVAIEPKSSTST